MGHLLRIHGPDGTVQEVGLPKGETTVGRDPSNELILQGRGVSRRHAKFVYSDDGLIVIDLGSTYGTRVNDVPTMRNRVTDGDRLTIGMHQLEVICGDEEISPPTDVSTAAAAMTFYPDDHTQDPGVADIASGTHGTIALNRLSVQFVVDDDRHSAEAQVVPRAKNDLALAVERLGASTSRSVVRDTATDLHRPADYQALMLMYKVTALLSEANDLDGFVAPVADLVIEASAASTVVVLLLGESGELVPRVIRHRGALHPGEVPISRTVVDLVGRENETVVCNDVAHDERVTPGRSLLLYNIRAVLAAPLIVHGESRGILYLHRSGPDPFSSADADLVSALAALLASGIRQAQLKARFAEESHRRKALERFHPPEVVERIFRQEGEVGTLDEHTARVLVCNMVGFESFADGLEPRGVARVLHEYYEALYEKIFTNGGSLVKLNDGWALALFGAPESSDRDAVWAVEAALSLCTEFHALRRLWPNDGAQLKLVCALDSGPVVAGFVGSADRLEYAAFGEPIIRCTGVARQCDETGIFVSDRTWPEIPQARYRKASVSLTDGNVVHRLSER